MQAGLLNTYQKPIQNRSALAWIISILLFAFYFLLYLPDYGYFPDYLNRLLHDRLGFTHFNKWNLYGLIYSAGMLTGGWFMLQKHGNSRYHRLRTYSLVSVQIVFAFSLPLVLKVLNQPELYLSYFWPLSYDKLFPDTLAALPAWAAVWFIGGSLIAFPLIAFYKGKRFYCSWICGCGGLAETFGDPWRHLSDKSAKAWRVEQISIYSVLALVLLTTGLMIGSAASTSARVGEAGTVGGERARLGLYLATWAADIKAAPEAGRARAIAELQATLAADGAGAGLTPALSQVMMPVLEQARAQVDAAALKPEEAGWRVEQAAYAIMPYPALSGIASKVKGFYAFFIGALFSGAAGVGLYPLMGTRVWCRFGCPMAAVLGLIQKFGQFRITVKKDMCISCGNCSAYCEMGIDVRQYAMANRDIQRASCVGCGMCAHVCPRGVLKLETRRDSGPGESVQEWVLDL